MALIPPHPSLLLQTHHCAFIFRYTTITVLRSCPSSTCHQSRSHYLRPPYLQGWHYRPSSQEEPSLTIYTVKWLKNNKLTVILKSFFFLYSSFMCSHTNKHNFPYLWTCVYFHYFCNTYIKVFYSLFTAFILCVIFSFLPFFGPFFWAFLCK